MANYYMISEDNHNMMVSVKETLDLMISLNSAKDKEVLQIASASFNGTFYNLFNMLRKVEDEAVLVNNPVIN